MLSIVGAILITILVIFESSNNQPKNDTIENTAIVGFLFICVCIFGITLALWPNWLRKIKKNGFYISYDRVHNNSKLSSHGILHTQVQNHPRRFGHHPTCGNFYGHTISYGGTVYCAGCLGLTLGAVFSIFFTSVFIFTKIILSTLISYLLIITGFLIISVTFYEVRAKSRNPVHHVMFNFLLILGFFFFIVSVVQVTNQLFLGVLALILSILWLDTRIQLSIVNHKKICFACSKLNCVEKMS
jgi:hypothetical protein